MFDDANMDSMLYINGECKYEISFYQFDGKMCKENA